MTGSAGSDLPTAVSLEEMRHKQVVVVLAGFVYRGLLLGADETDLYLKGQFRYLVLPLERVSSIRLAGERDGFDPGKSVEPTFYSNPD